MQTKSYTQRRMRSQRGMTLIELMIALVLILIAAVGVMTIALTAITTTENQGHLAARTAEYSQDKMEQLLALHYCDNSSNTTVFPATTAGGTGLGGCVQQPNPGQQITADPRVPGGTVGGTNPAAPVANYADYLCSDGSYAGTGGCTAANAYYIRVWQITNPAGANGNSLKQITVVTRVRNAVGTQAVIPQSTVTAIKSYPF
jgi:prepilin-type N-terminal cleavage/methylation domain-containing protein